MSEPTILVRCQQCGRLACGCTAEPTKYVPVSGQMKAGPSNSYLRLLTGKITSERYVAIVKRSVNMRAESDRTP